MNRRMTKEQAKAWKSRWDRVNAAEREELRSTSPEVRLRQLGTLMEWAKAFGWTDSLAAGEEEVRARWLRLREALGVRA